MNPETATPARGRLTSTAICLLVAVVAAACALFTSNNWLLVMFPAAIIAIVADCIVSMKWSRVLPRLFASVAVGIAVGFLSGVGPGWAFQEAFERDPPDGIRDIRIRRHYIGGPGEHALIIEFTADPTAIQTLIQGRSSQPENYTSIRWREAGGGWAQFDEVYIRQRIPNFARSIWERIPPMEHPELLYMGESNRGELILFRERDAERCVALHVSY